MTHSNSENVLGFLHVAEKLKCELRHSWASNGRQESVAEHSWRLALMVLITAPYLDVKIDLVKALKIAIIHDIGEAEIGDVHYLEVNKNEHSKKIRFENELVAVKKITEKIQGPNSEIFNLWIDFEKSTSPEAKLVKFLDQLEVCIQHNEACISTWTKEELDFIENFYANLSIEDNFLMSLKSLIESETFSKLFSKNK